MELPCVVKRVTFRRDNFAILACDLDRFSDSYSPKLRGLIKPFFSKKWKSFTVVVDSLEPGERPEGNSYIFVGEFVNDPRRGGQYKASGYYQDVPTDDSSMKSFLMTLPNIKEERANAIIKKFSSKNVIDMLDNEIEKLLEIKGISELRLSAIKEEWEKIGAKRGLYKFFSKHNVPLKLADKAYKIWGNRTQSVVSENPYALTKVRGIGFLQADLIAHRIDESVNQVFRVNSCINYCLREDSSKNGNLCLPYPSLKSIVMSMLNDCDSKLEGVSPGNYVEILPSEIKRADGDFIAVRDIPNKMSFVYRKEVWQREKFIAETLSNRNLLKSKFPCSEGDIIEAEGDVSLYLERDISLDGTQADAIKSAFKNRVTVITGGGGTGKSTICRCIFFLAKSKKMSVKMMSPTGKAAKVLSERTGGSATTIHRGLNIDQDSGLPEKEVNEDILLVDEISMAGLDTMYALMVAIESNPRANIVLVGDKNQLPSVSPGNFLSDLIDSGCANVVKLDRIHRQSEDSFISIIANKISTGVSPRIPENASDITWKNLSQDRIEEDIENFIEPYLENDEMEDLQVISPMKKGKCGVHRVNEVIQKVVSEYNGKSDRYIEVGFNKFFIGDKVIQTRNNYDKDVFNGDMGYIYSFGERARDLAKNDKKEKFIGVDFSGKKVYYYSEEIDDIILAWAITVHKFQGSQSRDIAMIIAPEATVMMNKELIYTGFTRAEKNLYIFGSETTYGMASSRSAVRKRFTNLNNIIKDCRSKDKVLKTT
jgi:exodeoxyribonuclease V alpha subunit